MKTIWFILYLAHHVYASMGPFPNMAFCDAAMQGYSETPQVEPKFTPSCEFRDQAPVFGERENGA